MSRTQSALFATAYALACCLVGAVLVTVVVFLVHVGKTYGGDWGAGAAALVPFAVWMWWRAYSTARAAP